jgi:hypothetical protein
MTTDISTMAVKAKSVVLLIRIATFTTPKFDGGRVCRANGSAASVGQ